MEHRTLRAGVIGCGRIAGSIEDEVAGAAGFFALPYGHAPAYRDADGVELVAAADTDVDIAKRYGARWGIDAVYGSAERMLADEAPDIVSICVPTKHHADAFCLAAEDPSVRGVFLEKPVGVSLAEARRMVDAAARGSVQVAVNHTRTYDPLWRRVKELVDGDAIGTIEAVTARWVEGWSFGGSHLFDLVRHLVDSRPRWVFCDLDDPAARDPGGVAVVSYESGVRMQVTMLERIGTDTEVSVHGTRGSVMVDGQGPRLYERQPDGRTVQRPFPAHLYWKSGMVRAVEQLTAAVHTGAPITSTLADGVAALETAIALHQSGATGARVELPVTDDGWAVDAP